MKKSLLFIWMLPLLIVSVVVPNVRAQSTTIGVEPDSIVDASLGPGESFTVEIWVRDVADLGGVEFKLGYDTTVLTATLIEYGDIFGPTKFDLISTINETDGLLHYSIMEEFDEPGVGDGRAAIIHFTVDSVGESPLNLYDTKLGDVSYPPASIDHEALDGYFRNVVTVHDVAVTNVTAYPTEVVASELVTVSVTVRNEGNFTETFSVTVYADIVPVPVGDEYTVGTQTATDLASGADTTLTFNWDTTGRHGDYTISANASTVSGETATTDNQKIDDKVRVLAPNIAVTNVVPSPTEVAVGDNVIINVTVKNIGDLSQTFNVTVYYDNTPIETQTATDLAPLAEPTLTFIWDTTGVEKGTYTIKAEASAVPGEANTADNTKIFDDTVRVGGAAPASNILLYVAAGVAIIIIVAVAIYILKFRK